MIRVSLTPVRHVRFDLSTANGCSYGCARADWPRDWNSIRRYSSSKPLLESGQDAVQLLRGERESFGLKRFRPRDAWRTVHEPDGREVLNR